MTTWLKNPDIRMTTWLKNPDNKMTTRQKNPKKYGCQMATPVRIPKSQDDN